MCFLVTITSAKVTQPEIRDAIEGFTSKSGVLLRTHKNDIFMTGPDGDCSCALLSEEADWGCDVWLLNDSFLADCAEAIKFIAACGAPEFTLTAMWQGDALKHNIDISTVMLADAFQKNEVRNFTEYHAKAK
jgi:hypothetical protein